MGSSEASIVTPGTYWRNRKSGAVIRVVRLDPTYDTKCQIRPHGDPNAKERTVWRRTVANGYDLLDPDDLDLDLRPDGGNDEEHSVVLWRDGEAWYVQCRAARCSFLKRAEKRPDADAFGYVHSKSIPIFAGDPETARRLLNPP